MPESNDAYEVEESGGGAVYRLAPRQSVDPFSWRGQPIRWLALGVLVTAMGTVKFSIEMAGGEPAMQEMMRSSGGLVVGVVFVLFGLHGIIGRVSIRVGERTFAVTEHIGGLRFTRRWTGDEITQFVIQERLRASARYMRSRTFTRITNVGKDLQNVRHVLQLDTVHGRSRTVISRYPREVLESVARDVAARVNPETAVPVDYEAYQDADHRPERKIRHAARVSRDGGVFSLYLPAPGFRGLSRVYSIGLVTTWISYGGIVVLLFAMTSESESSDRWALVALVVAGIFLMLLLLVSAMAVNKAYTQVIFDVDDVSLTMSRKSLVRVKRWSWPIEKIREIRCRSRSFINPDAMHGDDDYELQIVKQIGAWDGRMKDWRREELEWIAETLNREIGLAKAAAQGATRGPPGQHEMGEAGS